MVIATLVLALQVSGAATPQAPEPRRPDVAIFVIDDVADSDVDAIRTPALDRLMERGTRFRRAYSHAWCSPSRDSLMFSAWNGRYRGTDCEPSPAHSRPPDTHSIAMLFQSAGYTTAHFGKWHLGSHREGSWTLTPHVRGFDRVVCGMPVGNCTKPTKRKGRAPGAWLRLDDGGLSWSTQHRTIAIRDAFRTWWLEQDGPKFAMVNFRAAHAPFATPPDSILYDWASATESKSRRARFEDEVIGVDYVMGELEPILGSDSIVVFTSDNGTPGVQDHNAPRSGDATRPDQDPRRTKLSCYEDGVRIPLVIATPGGTRRESTALVHVVDLLPTLAELAGITMPDDPIDGVSFASVLTGEPGPRAWVYVHSNPKGPRSIIASRWKLVVHRDAREELFDLEQDPSESQPLPATNEPAEHLRSILAKVVLD